MLPTVEGDSTTILTTFYLSGGTKLPVTLPKYVFRPNTITKVTATIDPDHRKYLEVNVIPDHGKYRMECGSGASDYYLSI